MKLTVVSAQVSGEAAEALDVLAERFAAQVGRPVTRSEVIRAFIAQGLEANPVEELERRRFRATQKRPRRGPLPLGSGARPLQAQSVEKDGGEGGIRTRARSRVTHLLAHHSGAKPAETLKTLNPAA
jgi:hypothetical protein